MTISEHRNTNLTDDGESVRNPKISHSIPLTENILINPKLCGRRKYKGNSGNMFVEKSFSDHQMDQIKTQTGFKKKKKTIQDVWEGVGQMKTRDNEPEDLEMISGHFADKVSQHRSCKERPDSVLEIHIGQCPGQTFFSEKKMRIGKRKPSNKQKIIGSANRKRSYHDSGKEG